MAGIFMEPILARLRALRLQRASRQNLPAATKNASVSKGRIAGNRWIWAPLGPAPGLPSALPVNPLHEMDCPECATHVAPMAGSTWAIAWYSCGKCGTFWYARLRVGPGSDEILSDRMLGPAKTSTNGARLHIGSDAQAWTLEELEAEADALRRESDSLPKGDLEALRLHLEKLKVLADAINQRLDSHASATPGAA
jgi:hypothetical protein